MSKISLKPNASGTGVFSLEAPNSNTDRTLTLRDETGDLVTTATDLEPQVKDSLNATGSAPVYACRAWVNFDGTGTVSISDSGNVSSITDNGTGDFTVNFATAMPDGNYSVTGNAAIGDLQSFVNILDFEDPAASSIRFQTRFHDGQTETGPGSVFDYEYNFLAIFR